MVEILKQNQYVPMSVSQQVAIIYAGVNGYMDKIDLAKIGEYESGLMDYLSANSQAVLDSITSAGKIDEDTEKELKSALESYSSTFNN